MAQFNTHSSLPQGFSVFQPTLGAQLQFFPALGSQELDDMINAFISGPASIKEKRASISLDFLEHAQMTGHTFKFYPISPSSAAVSSPMTSVSSLNVSPIDSVWDLSRTPSSASLCSRSPSAQSQKQSKPFSRPSLAHPVTDFSHLPGMKILTKDGLDVTNTASRGSKTKEQRDHAHLMRIIKACDTCRRKKIRCDPSHKKRPASQSLAQPAAKPTKKARTASKKPSTASTPAVDDTLRLSNLQPFSIEPTFSFAGLDALEALDSTLESSDSWEQFVQYPPLDQDDNEYDYNFFLDPEGYFSSQPSSSSSSSTESPQKSLTPPSQPDQSLATGIEGWALDGLEDMTPPPFPYLEASSSSVDYTDFSLFSPSSSTSLEDEVMVPLASHRHLGLSQPLLDPTDVPGVDHNGGGTGSMTDQRPHHASISPPETSIDAQSHAPWRESGSSPGLQPGNDSSEAAWDVFIGLASPRGEPLAASPGLATIDRVDDSNDHQVATTPPGSSGSSPRTGGTESESQVLRVSQSPLSRVEGTAIQSSEAVVLRDSIHVRAASPRTSNDSTVMAQQELAEVLGDRAVQSPSVHRPREASDGTDSTVSVNSHAQSAQPVVSLEDQDRPSNRHEASTGDEAQQVLVAPEHSFRNHTAPWWSRDGDDNFPGFDAATQCLMVMTLVAAAVFALCTCTFANDAGPSALYSAIAMVVPMTAVVVRLLSNPAAIVKGSHGKDRVGMSMYPGSSLRGKVRSRWMGQLSTIGHIMSRVMV